MKGEGKKRFLELSVSLFGKEGAMRYGELSKNLGRPAPVPSIFIEGELVFEVTPIKGYLDKFLDELR